MEPSLSAFLLLALFAGSHLGLAWLPLRSRLVARLGVWGFTGLFVATAALTFSLLISFYAAHRGAGLPGPGLGRFELMRWVSMGVIVIGVALMSGALAGYPRSPMALGNQRVREPYGLDRITRHAFFVGTALLGLTHALLATHLIGSILMGGLGIFALLGARLQDQKLLALRGEPYAAYLAATSTLPFAAILAGRQRVVSHELPWRGFAVGLLIALALRQVHGQLFDRGGLYVAGATVGGALFLALQTWLRERRTATATVATGG